MLTKLEIDNFVYIQKASINFGEGLNIFSGETGAGKSMVFKALAIALGEKASGNLVRVGAKFLKVSLVFEEVRHPHVEEILNNLALPSTSSFELQRFVSAEGKSKALIGGVAISVARLQELSPYLLDVHSQHQQQYLLDNTTHVLYFDAFADLKALRLKFDDVYLKWKHAKQKYRIFNELKAKAEKEKAFLEFQFAELEEAAISKEEYEKLKIDLKNFTNREARTNTFLKMHETLQLINKEGVESLYEQLNAQLSRNNLAKEDIEELSNIKEKIHAITSLVSKVIVDVEGKIERFDFLKAIDEINHKLAKVEALMRKQGISIEELWKKHKEISTALSKLNENSNEEQEMLSNLKVSERDAIKTALTLHVRRKEAVSNFEERVLQEISYLGMTHSSLKVFLQPNNLAEEINNEEANKLAGNLGPYGLSRLEFLYSSAAERNPEKIKKIISGGELSRVMLALKVILSEKIPVSTMVFDEVDTGIGGEVASHVGEKLKQLAEKKQVIVITHLAQIARFAKHHFLVDRSSENSSVVVVKKIEKNEIKKEISRMLGGASFTSGGTLAGEMLGDANEN